MGTSQKDKIIIGIDQGTTGTTVVAVDASLNTLASWYGRHTQHRPGSGLLEHDPQEILTCVTDGIGSVLNELSDDAGRVVAAGLANQGETVCAWDTKTGEPFYNALVWSDSRGAECIEDLSSDQKHRLREITGLQPDTYFSAAKFAWLINNVPDVRKALKEGRLAIGTTDTWFVWQLTDHNAYMTDASTASRTMLYDLAAGQWSHEAHTIMDLPLLPLPEIGPSIGKMASLSHPDWPTNALDLHASLVDQPAALFANGCWDTGQAKITYGTGCFLLINTGNEILTKRGGLTASVAWDIGNGPNFMIDGAVYAAGSIIEWLKEEWGWVQQADEIDKMLADLPQRNGLFFVPTLDGLSAPYWNRDARGLLAGLTLATKPAEILRAALDGIAHQVADLVDCVSSSAGFQLEEIHVDGGLSACNYLMQKQADMLGLPVIASENPEMTVLGAAAMAGLGAGVWKREELLGLLSSMPRRTYQPTMSATKRLAERNKWQQAVDLTIAASKI